MFEPARLARYGNDFPQLERLGRAAVVGGVTPEAGLLLGEALHELGRFPEADEVLAAAEEAAADDDALLVPITEIRTRNLMWGLLRPDEALAVNGDVRERLRHRPGVGELTLNEALLLTYSGCPPSSRPAGARRAPTAWAAPSSSRWRPPTRSPSPGPATTC